ncbi:conserved hypothetical protein [Thioalkalivibrio sulfidiphilus HL-EbGr7]|uniref:RES domain-containing protein n=1 Tax=Thioalkalivibrio sulfidiphilus (strain HL-EbGR7) TaxID=396588 RepID=B8GS94_THISH|nr:RES domain-containing protein [Thioalkalivibrio sulfidiphilus]ACL72798.1 conserved hypothetical protein [Thioalkalivibrio sulfidiphilus HL-EbGr7]
MYPDIWAACRETAAPGPLKGTLLRLVESQEQVATNRLVDSLEEQAALEAMLEATKPPLPAEGPRHYLLVTPFRYPPLRHGSRFGRRFEPSLFYGSLSLSTLLAEAAFYRFYFWYGMAIPPASALVTRHTVFEAAYRSRRGLRLQEPPFDAFRDALTHPADYRATQQLGTALREAGVQAFEYRSARDEGINVALFTPRALADARPRSQEHWLCETDGAHVRFLGETQTQVHVLPLERFLVEGVLPMPAA